MNRLEFIRSIFVREQSRAVCELPFFRRCSGVVVVIAAMVIGLPDVYVGMRQGFSGIVAPQPAGNQEYRPMLLRIILLKV